MTLALFLLGLASLISDEGDATPATETNALGITMMGLSLIFTGIQFIVEEKLLSESNIHALKVVDDEGMWGTIIYIIA